MEKYKVTETRRMKFDGVFDLRNYYRVLYDVFRGMNYDVYEMRYAQKKLAEGVEELEIVWSCIKEADVYGRFRIHAKTLVTGLKKVQVQIEGANVNREQGSCELEIIGYLETDYLNKWAVNPILRQFKWIYDTYIYRPVFTFLAQRLVTETYAAENEIKAFFNMQKML